MYFFIRFRWNHQRIHRFIVDSVDSTGGTSPKPWTKRHKPLRWRTTGRSVESGGNLWPIKTWWKMTYWFQFRVFFLFLIFFRFIFLYIFSCFSCFCWLLASVGLLTSVGFWLLLAFWLLPAFWVCWLLASVGFSALLAIQYIEEWQGTIYRNAGFWLALASGDFCFFFFLLLLLLLFCCCGGGSSRGFMPGTPFSLEIFEMKLYDILWFCVCCCFLLFVILLLFCICWWSAIALPCCSWSCLCLRGENRASSDWHFHIHEGRVLGVGGWGGDDNVLCTCTHRRSYVFNSSCCTCPHGWCYVFNFNCCTCTHGRCYVFNLSCCTCTHGRCYVFNLSCCTCTHGWCYVFNFNCCTCTHGRCYVFNLGCCTCPHGWWRWLKADQRDLMEATGKALGQRLKSWRMKKMKVCFLQSKKSLEMSKCWIFDHSNSNSYNNNNLWPKSHSTKLLVCLHPKLNEWPYFSVLMTCYFFDASQKRTVIALSKQTFPTKQKAWVWFCPVKYNGLCYVPNSSTCRCQHNTKVETPLKKRAFFNHFSL